MKKSLTKLKKNSTFLSILLLMLIVTSITFFSIRNGLLRGHDLTFHLSRIKGLKESLQIPDIKALIHPGLYGYGYANGLFYGNLFIYFPAILNLLGLSLCKSYVIFTWICSILTAISMFVLVKRITKSNQASVLASILYTLSAYRICDLVVRAAIGEILSFMIIPIVILGLYEIIYGDYKKWYLFSIGFVLLVQAHIISTVIMAILCIVMIIANLYHLLSEKVRLKYLIFSGILGVLLGAFFIFPLLEQYLIGDLEVSHVRNNIGSNCLPIERIFLGFSYYSNAVFYPPGVGILLIVVSLLRFKIKDIDKEEKKIIDLFLIIGFGCLICITGFFPWKELADYVGFMQFAWRLYLFATVFLSISAGMIIKNISFKTSKRKIIVIIIFLQIISTCINIYYSFYAVHNYWGVAGMEYISGYDDYYVGTGEYLPNKTDLDKLRERGEVVTSNNDSIHLDYEKNKNRITIEYSNNNQKDTYIEVPLLYYKGYTVKSNKKEYPVKKGTNNIIRVYLTSNSDKIMIYYKGTTIQKISSIVSFFALIFLVYYLGSRRGIFCHDKKKKR